MSGNGTTGWANPSPAGLVGYGVACFTFFALLTGRVSAPGALPLLGCWLIGGFVIQLVVALIELREGALSGGNVFLFFSAFFMLTGGLGFFVKYFLIINKLPMDGKIDGWAWLVLFIILVFCTFAYLRESSKIMGLLFIVLTIAVFFVAMIDIGLILPSYKPVAGWGLLISGSLGIYQSGSIIINSAYKKQILPTGKSFLQPQAK